MIDRLLVANRGEIARRVFRTCRELGIGTVAVHSDADASMPFVAEADVAVRLPGNTASETYLRGDLIVEAAVRSGADAVHPGYGFLSESAAFARAVIDAGLIWVGPEPASIEAMGSKVEAKRLMTAAGVPVLDELDAGTVTAADLPFLVKASAGGGGRGMRVVRSLDALAAEIDAARAEAASAFGDGTVFVEPYVQHGRHVEVQVLGTPDGTVVLGERDCSVQRRHQKVIEESPAPALDGAVRDGMHEAARRAADAVGYRGAGTVEMLLDAERNRFWFLEMNTRLQVEHPVTEAVFGVDLVALQIGVAEGRPVADLLGGLRPYGHAVEARLYAEDPTAGYRPQSGRLTRFEVPGVIQELGGPRSVGVRLDSGVASGDTIATFYDAMIAKVVAWAPTRDEAIRRLAASLERAEIHGVRTNRDLLVGLLRDPVLTGARMDTTWLDGADIATLGASPVDADGVAEAAFAATVALAEQARRRRPVQQRIPVGYRNVVSAPHVTLFEDADGGTVPIRWHGGSPVRWVDHDDAAVLDVVMPDGSPDGRPVTVVVGRDGLRRTFEVHLNGGGPDDGRVDVESAAGHVALRRIPRFADPEAHVLEGSLVAPMPGNVVAVHVAVGDVVAEGQTLLVVEAMKMQHTIAAPVGGTVVELPAEVGRQVDAGSVLAVVGRDLDEVEPG